MDEFAAQPSPQPPTSKNLDEVIKLVEEHCQAILDGLEFYADAGDLTRLNTALEESRRWRKNLKKRGD